MSSLKTTKLGLHNWNGTDRVLREEMNENFTVIDSEIGSLRNDVNNSLTHIGTTAPVDTDRFWLDLTGRFPTLRYFETNVDDWLIVATLEASNIQLSADAAALIGVSSIDDAFTSIKLQTNIFAEDFITVSGRIDNLVSTVDKLSLKLPTTLIVDPTNAGSLYPTVQSALNTLPKHLQKDVVILVSSNAIWTEDFAIEGFYGFGRITIDFTSRARIVTGQVWVRQCSSVIVFQNVFFKGVDKGTFDPTLGVINSAFVQLKNVQIDALTVNTYGISVSNSFLHTQDCIISNAGQYAINAIYGSKLEINNVYGSSPGGIRAEGAVHIGGSGKAPLGTTGGTNLTLLNGAMCNVAFTHSAT